MRILLDHNIPISLRDLLITHNVTSTRAMGWDRLQNGMLLKAAEQDGFDVLLTADQSIFYQQNNRLRRIALVGTSTNHRPSLELNIHLIDQAVATCAIGTFQFVIIPILD